ncbi:MAG: hypothetical protein WCG34_03065 [Leptolinea sp.]
MLKRFVILTIIIATLFVPAAVFAQAPVAFSKIVINVWPEYDRPGVLVFYQIALSPQTNLPATLSLRIPKAAGKPFNVAMKDIDGRLDTLPSTSQVEGDWVKVTFTSPVPEVQFEYYDPSITSSASLHEFQYTWPGDFDVASLVLVVQQPLAAGNFQIQPTMGSGRTSDDGFTYFESVVGEIKAGIPFSINLKYNKTGTDLSAPSQSVTPVEPVTTSARWWQNPEVLPYVLGGLGFLLILAGGYWYWRSGKTLTTAFRRRHAPARVKETEAEATGVFCHRCGRKGVIGDVFCRSCGTKLKTE